MQTRHSRPRWKAYSISQLVEQLEKVKTPKILHKIRVELERKQRNAGLI